jgi:hypothetical protein
MPEYGHRDAKGSLPDAAWNLIDALGRVGERVIKFRDFLGRQVARDALERYGILDQFDDSFTAAIIDIAGTGVVTGMILSREGRTDPLDIESEIVRLMDPVPEALRPIAKRLTSFMIPTGIEFQRNELAEGSPRVMQWTQEFQALQLNDIDLG